jgi:hypothetical protein
LKRSLSGRFLSAFPAFGSGLFLIAMCAASALAGPPDGPVAKPSPLIGAMQTELDRSFRTLSTQDIPAYFIGYTLTDTQRAEVSGSNGALLSSSEARNRWLQVAVRTGTYDMDDTHKVGERQLATGGPGTVAPVDDDPEVLRRAIWLETDDQYRAAAEALIKIRTSREVKVETAEGRAPDFSKEQPHKWSGPQVSFSLDRKPWEDRVRAYTKGFRESPAILNSIVTFSALAQNTYQVNTEGTQLQFGQIRYRLELFIQGKAADGMDIERYYNFDWVDPKDAPDDKAVATASATLRKEMEGLVKAPINEPTDAPRRFSSTRFSGTARKGTGKKTLPKGRRSPRKSANRSFPSF